MEQYIHFATILCQLLRQQVLLEWQRDWAHRDTYDAVMAIVREHSGAYGMGVDYAYTMVHKAPERTTSKHEVLAPVPAK